MEQLAEINFIATIEGQEEERAMAKIVSSSLFPFLYRSKAHIRMCKFLDP